MIGSTLKEVRAAKSAAAQVFAELVGTVAVGVMRLAGKDVVLPSQVAGVPVKVEVVGKIRKR
jgi:hypothetical protein